MTRDEVGMSEGPERKEKSKAGSMIKLYRVGFRSMGRRGKRVL